jgi:hypothetical protein
MISTQQRVDEVSLNHTLRSLSCPSLSLSRKSLSFSLSFPLASLSRSPPRSRSRKSRSSRRKDWCLKLPICDACWKSAVLNVVRPEESKWHKIRMSWVNRKRGYEYSLTARNVAVFPTLPAVTIRQMWEMRHFYRTGEKIWAITYARRLLLLAGSPEPLSLSFLLPPLGS